MADQNTLPAWAQDAPSTPALAQDTPAAPAAPSTPPAVPMAGIAPDQQAAYQAVNDKLFQPTPPGRIMSVVYQAFGTDQPLGLSDETTQHLRDTGMFNDFSKGQNDFIKNFNEAVMRPAAVAINSSALG